MREQQWNGKLVTGAAIRRGRKSAQEGRAKQHEMYGYVIRALVYVAYQNILWNKYDKELVDMIVTLKDAVEKGAFDAD